MAEKKVRVKGINWSHEETRALISLVAKKNILRLTTSKGFKQLDLYKTLEPLMKEKGFTKAASQMQIKMKHLKEAYYKYKRENWKVGASGCPFAYFTQMDELLRFKRPTTVTNSAAIPEEEQPAIHVDQSDSVRECAGIDTDNCGINADNFEVNADYAEVDADNSRIDADHSRIDWEPGPSSTAKIAAVPKPIEVKLLANSNDTPTKTGRLSYKKRAQEFSEIFCSKQAAMFNEILEKQNKSLEESIRKQLQQQRNWEMHILQQQYENQMEQNRTLLDEFFRRLQPAAFLPEPLEEDAFVDTKTELDCNVKIEQNDF